MFSAEKMIDLKHAVYYDMMGAKLGIAKRLTNGELQPIPDSEPVILFRGRDKLALRMLEYYRGLCVLDNATPYQLETMDEMIARFRAFAATSPTMKQPGVTKGI